MALGDAVPLPASVAPPVVSAGVPDAIGVGSSPSVASPAGEVAAAVTNTNSVTLTGKMMVATAVPPHVVVGLFGLTGVDVSGPTGRSGVGSAELEVLQERTYSCACRRRS